ncbi:cation channel family protein (macronuclear) [Tetrahymena thermophila SB210]|uniref:Cation channel family protein n=1 Tax=Tetrahymena thermophila (strain SB210) TaxID=312017 RepID=W7XHY0_TETTS|nr:cation channel family protein [Tetrahymena thermophila SB210]EWS74161.1 cation channel family protein [Tetrahymena thermophila SB210]|eukprot:XP_012653301.1 cation channel family protein [Tetrahymena thermophila SB210]
MDQKLETSNRFKKQVPTLFYQQMCSDENKYQELEIKDIYVDRLCQRQLFELQINQPQKIHDGDKEISYKSFQADVNESLQKSLKDINNNQSLIKSQQALTSFNMNQIPQDEQIDYQPKSNKHKHHYEESKTTSKQNSKKKLFQYEENNRESSSKNESEKESSNFSELNQRISSNSKNFEGQKENQNQLSNMDINNSQKSQSQIAIQDEMIYEKDLKVLGTKINTAVKIQYFNKQETMVIMRIRQNVKTFIYNLKIRHSNRKLDDLSEKEYQNINDLSHFYRQKDQIHKSFKIFLVFSKILKKTQKLAIFMPTDTSRVIWDLVQVVFTYTFFYLYSIIIFFDQNDFDTNFIQQISFYAFVFFLLDILVNLNTAFFDKDIIITRRKLIAKQYILSSIFITDLISMFILGSKVIYSNSFISNNTNQNLFLFGLNLLIFLKGNGISSSVITVAHIAAIGWYFVGISESNNNQNNWLDKLSISSYTYYQKYIYSIYWSITTMTTVGYGDISASNSAEALYITITMILFSCVFAYSINNIGFILQEIEKSSKQLNDDITTIQRYLIRKDVNIQLKSRVRHYLSFLAQEQKDRDKQQEDKILSVLSNKLRDEITQEINSKILNNYLIFSSNFSQSTLNKLIFIMQEILVNPNEVIITEGQSDDSSIYFIQNGIIEIYQQQIQKQNMITVVKTLTKGQIFGEISFFSGLQRQSSARSVNLSTLYKINREEFIEILKENTEDFERFKMMQDQIIFQKDITITHSECYSCKNSGHLANQCPRTHKYFDKQFTILKQNFSMFQERLFKERVTIKSKFNAKILWKKNQGIVLRLKQSIQKEDDEMYQMFTNEENFNTDYSQSQFDNEDNQDDEEEDSQSQTTIQFDDKENEINIKKIQQQLEKAEKQVKTMNQFNSNLTNCEDAEQLASLENQIQNLNSNFIYENQDFARAKSNTLNSQGISKSFEASGSIDTINQDFQSSQQKSIRAIYKKDTKIEIQPSLLSQDDYDDGQNSNKSKKFDKQKQMTINAQFTDYLKSQMKYGPYYSNLNKHIQKQVSNQSVDDNSQYQQTTDIPILPINKIDNNQRKSKTNHFNSPKKNSYKKSLIQNQSQKELRSSVEQMLLQNIVQMGLTSDKRNSGSQNKSNESNFNYDKNGKIQNSSRSIRDNNQQKSNQYLSPKNNNQNQGINQDQNKQLQQQLNEKMNNPNQNENQQLFEKVSKLLQNMQLPLLLQLTNGKSLLQDSQFIQSNSIDYFDKIQQFKKFYPENNFDKVLHKLKAVQQEQKKQKKMKLASKERRQNIGFGNTIRVSIFQGNANIIRFQPLDYDINLYKPTYLSYGTKMQKGVNYPLNMLSKNTENAYFDYLFLKLYQITKNYNLLLLINFIQHIYKIDNIHFPINSDNSIRDYFGFHIGYVLLNLNQILKLEVNLRSNLIHSQGVIELSKGLKKCQIIHTLLLKLSNNPIDDFGIINLCSSINSYGNLNYLLLDLISTQITSKTAKYLINDHSNWDNLDTLILCLSFNKIGDQGVSELGSALKNLKKVSSLELYLRDTGINTKGINTFGQYLGQCISIQNLTLNLVQNNICSKGKSNLGFALSNCINLSSLNIYLQENYFELSNSDKVINQFKSYLNIQIKQGDPLISSLEKCTNLQKLDIELGSNKINDQTVKSIGISLKSLNNLSYLKIELRDNKISSEGFSGLCSGLESSKNLQVLRLFLGNNKIDDGAFINFKLKQLEKLADLSLDFYENKISFNGVCILSFEIANLKNLQSIYLDFNKTLIDDQSLNLLGFNLGRLASLKEIKLFLSDNLIRSLPLITLIQPLSQVKNLKVLQIYLRNKYTQISFQKDLAIAFQKLLNLLYLSLIIKDYNNIGNSLNLIGGGIDLIQNIKKMKRLVQKNIKIEL